MEIIENTLINGLDKANDAKINAAVRQLHLNGLDLEKESMLLCPIHKRGLIGTAVTRPPKYTSMGAEVIVGYNMPYAAIVHETMEPATAVKQMKPGPITRAKPPTKFGKAGGKYLERPLVGKAKVYTKHIAKAMKAAT